MHNSSGRDARFSAEYSYNASGLTVYGEKIVYDESNYAGFGPYRFGTRGEENRIFGDKPFRYLQDRLGCIWDNKWTIGYIENKTVDGAEISVSVSDGGTIETKAGKFENCLKLTLVSEQIGMSENYYFNDFRYTEQGKKEFWFCRGVGIVRFDYTWGTCLSASSELTSYVNLAGSDEYMPVYLGSGWEYDETHLTKEGYRAKRLIKVLSGMNNSYLISDCQDFLYLGTEEEYEEFKRKLSGTK